MRTIIRMSIDDEDNPPSETSCGMYWKWGIYQKYPRYATWEHTEHFGRHVLAVVSRVLGLKRATWTGSGSIDHVGILC